MKKGNESQIPDMQDEPIAIVGMASQFPDTGDLFDFWNNISEKKYSIKDVDEVSNKTYWDKGLYFDSDPQAKDKTYAHQAGFIKPIDFDPVGFKIPPVLVESISTAQLFALHVAKQAVLDAGMDKASSPVNKDKVGVILGGAGNGNTSFSLMIRQQIPVFLDVAKCCGIPESVVHELGDRLLGGSIDWNEDSFPGFLGNVACGRIASYFDFGGTSNMVDAACASSHAAIKSAIYELRSGSCDAVLTGGVNLENSIFSFMCFSKTPALSKAGISKPFDKDSDGMLLGDGVGILVLKRLKDAEAHGDRIYAVIKGIEASSDGRAKSIFAPRDAGQVKALDRAYHTTGVSPEDVELIEAHGTGTAAGDETELNSLNMVYSNYDIAPNSVAVGSIKSQIGHTRCAAGAASLMKVAMALHHKVLPPTINVETPAKIFQDENTPFYVNSEARPWIRRDENKPRLGAVSAFGFGGTNYHILIEEYEAEHTQEQPYRVRTLPELVILHDATPHLLLMKIDAVLQEWQGEQAESHFREFITHQSLEVPLENARLTFTAASAAEAVERLNKVKDLIAKEPEQGLEHPSGIYYQAQAVINSADEVVMCFPGQGSQYVDMARDMANNFPEMRVAIEKADQYRRASHHAPISSLIYPIPKFTGEQKAADNERLTSTENAQPALAAISAGYANLLTKLGLEAKKFAGHSFGEITALWAAGGIDEAQLYRLAQGRGHAMYSALSETDEPGSMAAVGAAEEVAEQAIKDFPRVSIANCNSPKQTVIAGDEASIVEVVKALKAQKIKAQKLNVSAAFHSPFVEAAKQTFTKVLAEEKIKRPRHAFYSNVSGKKHGVKADAIRQSLADQLTCSVRFVEMIETIYAEGGRLFVEVGPKGVLSRLINQILAGKPHHVVSVNPSDKGDSATQFFTALAKLVALGIEFKATDPYRLRPAVSESVSKMAVHLDGGNYIAPPRLKRIKASLEDNHQVFEKALEPIIAQAVEQQKSEFSQQLAIKSRQLMQMEDDIERLHEKNNTLSEENSALKAQIAQLEAQWNEREPVVEIIQSPKSDSQGVVMSNNQNPQNSVILEQLDLQKQVNQVHSQFQTNQMEYLKVLEGLFEKQHRLLEKYDNNPKFDHILQHLGQTAALLEKNQAMYHVNHEQYFQSQRTLTTGRVEGSGMSNQTVAMQAPMNTGASTVPPVSAPVSAVEPESAPVDEDIQADNKKVSVSQDLQPQAPVTSAAAKAPEFQAPAEMLNGSGLSAPERQPEEQEMVVAESSGNAAGSQLSAKMKERLESLTEEELCGELIEIVSQKTGYPTDMIEVDMDLEADLGIDSIKRIEIFGALFEDLLGADADQTDRDNFDVDELVMDEQEFDAEDFSTIRKIASVTLVGMQEILEADAKAQAGGGTSATQLAQDKPEGKVKAVDKVDPTETEEVKSRTMQLGFLASTSDNSDNSSKEVSTSGKKSQPQPSAAVNAEIASTEKVANQLDLLANQSGVLRLQSEIAIVAMPDQQNFGLAEGYLWIVAEAQKGTAKPLVQMLQDSQQHAVTLTLLKKRRPGRKKASTTEFELVAVDEAEIGSLLAKIEETSGKKIGGFIFTEDQAETHPVADLLVDDTRTTIEQVFFLAKHLQTKLLAAGKAQSAYFFVTVRNDGCLGTTPAGRFSVTNSGLTGLVKSLGYEWPEVHCRYVDISAECDKATWHTCLLRELSDPNGRVNEVAYNEKQQRQVKQLTLLNSDAITAESTLSKDNVVLVTGGARGITAKCIEQLAEVYPATYLLVGRTPLAELPEWTNGEVSESALKPLAMAYLKEQGDKPTPVAVNQLIRPVLNQQEVRENLKRIAKSGAKVEYVAMDVQDEVGVKEQIAQLEQSWGKVTGLVHGAGNLADKKIDQKTLADFQAVFATKIDGLQHLLSAIDPTQLKHLIMFSSVSGYFGNAGQTDYSTANEVLSGFAQQFQHQFPNCLVRALNWGPWDGGMVNATLKKAYEARGMVLIPMDVGTQVFVNEFATDPKLSSQVIVGGREYRADIKPTALLGEPKTALRQLTIDANPTLKDHQIGGNYVLPATYGLEWLVAQVLAYYPGYFLHAVQKFDVLKGVMVTDDTVEYQVSLTCEQGLNEKQPVIKAQVSSLHEGKAVFHYRAEICLGAKAVNQPTKAPKNLATIVEMPLPIYHGEHSGYLFHGPAFQGLEKVIEETDASMSALCSLAEPVIMGQFGGTSPINPTALDVCLQVPYLWLRKREQKVGLPLAIGELKHYAALDYAQPFVVSMTLVKKTANMLMANISVYTLDGKVLLEMSDVQYTVVKSITEDENKYLEEVVA